jgi:nitrite reductase/ring-hydroxylating ferredoxin subunit
MAVAVDRLIRVGKIEEITKPRIVSGGRHGIAVFADGGNVYAVDNRCPHMGFPLHRGSICDGILTCHWHHARFDLASGGTFDPFADDVRTYDTVIEDGVVYVDPQPKATDQEQRWKARLHDGLEQNLSLVMVKSVLGLQEANVPAADVVEIGARFGSTFRRAGWGPGLTILTAMANSLPALSREDQALALYHGMVHVASDVSGAPPRFQLDPLPQTGVPIERQKLWFRQFIEVRDADGAERALLSAIDAGATPEELSDMLLAAATDHVFLDGGHTYDFINKACEMLDLVGWDQAIDVLPSVVRGLAMARRSEELNIWRHPVDLVVLLDSVNERLPTAGKLFAAKSNRLSSTWSSPNAPSCAIRNGGTNFAAVLSASGTKGYEGDVRRNRRTDPDRVALADRLAGLQADRDHRQRPPQRVGG